MDFWFEAVHFWFEATDFWPRVILSLGGADYKPRKADLIQGGPFSVLEGPISKLKGMILGLRGSILGGLD